jgi:hypothetical protein
VATTTPLFAAAFSKLLVMLGLTKFDRSNYRVYISFNMMTAKVSLSRVLLISTSALGTTLKTKDFPSATISASRGATTEVLPK